MSHPRTASISLHSSTNDHDLDICDYTIGWISTNDHEYMAATWVLDKMHEPNDTFLKLNNKRKFNYRLGRMGNHNIAISIPSGYLNASAVIDDMLLTFPSLRFVLLVGTASGVPRAESHERIDAYSTDVRLGDVVIGTRIVAPCCQRIAKFPGTELEQSPSRTISTGITEFKLRLSDGLDIQPSVTSLVQEKSRHNNHFSRPDPQSDPFYQVDYAHTPTIFGCVGPSATQASRTASQTPRTHDHRVKVHYGPVASVDQRIVDARMRDELAHQNTLLCFLTGPSDLGTKIDCLPICGICDYAGLQQYSSWHGYAALTAAVCAKEFLGSVTEYMVLEMRVRASVEGIKWVIDGYVEQAKRLDVTINSLERHKKIVDRIQSRVDTLERMISAVQNKQADMLDFANVDVESIIALDKRLKEALEQMEDKIMLQIKMSNYVTRDEWEQLRERVSHNTARLDTIQECVNNLNKAIDLGEGILDKLGVKTNNRKLREIAEYLRISKEARDAIARWTPDIRQRMPGYFDKSSRNTGTPGQRKTPSKWQGKLLLWKSDRNSTNNSVADSTEVPGIHDLSSPSDSLPNSLFNENKGNDQEFPMEESERLQSSLSPVSKGQGFTAAGNQRPRRVPPPVPPKRLGSEYARQNILPTQGLGHSSHQPRAL
ncbi:hypothetical protein BDW42DRAFT_112086 [Aspergillus taichungensis]|uniref:Nucleoside phosphorylase domain-containing protein n=1 Tax=Aspergillus taichungensis TaxID=482145 RepID=A0A2J5HTB7_9EURO|nr:hypothetical protein BDW42DRAFT_112086 [Aspergillus taichungensis]